MQSKTTPPNIVTEYWNFADGDGDELTISCTAFAEKENRVSVSTGASVYFHTKAEIDKVIGALERAKKVLP